VRSGHGSRHPFREHAVQLRDRYDDIKAAGGDIVAVGTGDQRYAEAFTKDEQIPFLVLVVHKPGMRVKQIGATFVIGAGDKRRYEHMDSDSTDHADIDVLVSTLRTA
jgi:peroxiredoxin